MNLCDGMGERRARIVYASHWFDTDLCIKPHQYQTVRLPKVANVYGKHWRVLIQPSVSFDTDVNISEREISVLRNGFVLVCEFSIHWKVHCTVFGGV